MKSQTALRHLDSGLFTAAWWPHLTISRGRILVYLINWVRRMLIHINQNSNHLQVFYWDDGKMRLRYYMHSTLTTMIEFDNVFGNLGNNFQAAQEFRTETINYLEQCLAVSNIQVPTPTKTIISCFKVIGDAVCETYDKGMMSLLSSV